MTRQRLKRTLAIVGLVLSAAALQQHNNLLTWIAIGFLVAAVLLRFFSPPPQAG